jgi:hypothetical protein
LVPSVREAPERPYHHGDLKRVLLENAHEMLRDGEGWQFTLCRFPNEAALLADFSARGYRRLEVDLIAALALERRGSARSQAIAVAKADLNLGGQSPALHELMFSSEIDKNGEASGRETSSAALSVMVGILTRGQQAGEFRAVPVEGQATALWGLVHGLVRGLTVLERGRHLSMTEDGPMISDATIASLLEGLDA